MRPPQNQWKYAHCKFAAAQYKGLLTPDMYTTCAKPRKYKDPAGLLALLVGLPACLWACLAACLPGCMLAWLPASLPTCGPACLLACLPSCLPTCLPARLHNFPPCYVPAANERVFAARANAHSSVLLLDSMVLRNIAVTPLQSQIV